MGMDKEETKLKLACKVSAFHAGQKNCIVALEKDDK